jgi:hypothetical protein
VSFIITPSTEGPWSVDPRQFADELTAKWPDVKLSWIVDLSDRLALEWVLTIDGKRVDGAVARSGRRFHIDGDLGACAAFTEWFCTKYVACASPLAFFDETYSNEMQLSPSTRALDVVATFSR